jgi:hypothetical protein
LLIDAHGLRNMVHLLYRAEGRADGRA